MPKPMQTGSFRLRAIVLERTRTADEPIREALRSIPRELAGARPTEGRGRQGTPARAFRVGAGARHAIRVGGLPGGRCVRLSRRGPVRPGLRAVMLEPRLAARGAGSAQVVEG